MAGRWTQEKITGLLDWAYDTAISGPPPFDSAEDLAASYMQDDAPVVDQVNSLIRFQVTKAATSGFLSGLGGLITLPITVPANVGVVIVVQLRMIAAIAIMGGHDVRDDQVKALVYACLVGNGAKEIVREAGIKIGEKLALSGIRRIPGAVLTKINQAVGFRLLTKFGEKGVVNFGKAIPLVGGVIGGTVEAISTNAVGNVARDIFTATDPDQGPPATPPRSNVLPSVADTSVRHEQRGVER